MESQVAVVVGEVETRHVGREARERRSKLARVEDARWNEQGKVEEEREMKQERDGGRESSG